MSKRIKVTAKHLQKHHPVLNAFLVRRRLRSKFLKNCATFRLDQIKLLSIGGAFTWSDTSEQHIFWSELQDEFIRSL